MNPMEIRIYNKYTLWKCELRREVVEPITKLDNLANITTYLAFTICSASSV